MSIRTVDLSEQAEQFVTASVADGRFASVSDAVNDGLRLLEEEEEGNEEGKLEALRAAVTEGFDAIERGEYLSLRSCEEIRACIRRLGEEAGAELGCCRERWPAVLRCGRRS